MTKEVLCIKSICSFIQIVSALVAVPVAVLEDLVAEPVHLMMIADSGSVIPPTTDVSVLEDPVAVLVVVREVLVVEPVHLTMIADSESVIPPTTDVSVLEDPVAVLVVVPEVLVAVQEDPVAKPVHQILSAEMGIMRQEPICTDPSSTYLKCMFLGKV